MVSLTRRKQYRPSSVNELILPGNNFRWEDVETLNLGEHYSRYYFMKIGVIALSLRYC